MNDDNAVISPALALSAPPSNPIRAETEGLSDDPRIRRFEVLPQVACLQALAGPGARANSQAILDGLDSTQRIPALRRQAL